MERDGVGWFEGDCVRFAYPSNWTQETERGGDGTTVSLQSAGVTFAIVGVYDHRQTPDELLEQAIDTLREEHPALELEPLEDDEDAGPDEDRLGAELLFLSLDMLSYCWLESWRAGDRTVLVMMQSIEPESRLGRAVFRAICRSLTPIEGE